MQFTMVTAAYMETFTPIIAHQMTLMCCSRVTFFVTQTDIGLNLSRVFRAATGRGAPAVRVRMNWIRHECWLSFSCSRFNAMYMSSLLFTVGRCLPIPHITNAKADSVMALPGNRVTYTCTHGYSFANKAAEYAIDCYNTSWDHSDAMSCQGRPGIIIHFLTRKFNETKHTSMVLMTQLSRHLAHFCIIIVCSSAV